MSSGMEEILQIFFEEATQNLDELEELFLQLNNSTEENSQDFKVMFRIAHNLKGSSKSVGFSQIGKVTHELETLLNRLSEGKIALSQEIVQTLLKTIDCIQVLLSSAKETGSDIADSSAIIDQLIGHYSKGADKNAASHGADILHPSENLTTAPAQATTTIQDGDIIFVSEPEIPPNTMENLKQEKVESEVKDTPKVTEIKKNSHNNETVRVPTFRIDRLQNHVGEILVLQSVLSEQLKEHPSALVRNTLRQMRKVTREVQDESMSLRLVPIKGLFSKLTRAVHDAASILNKKVTFLTSGEETEIDKVLFEGLADPLMHMVRNAVDHGLETTEERIATGKSPTGKVELCAKSEGAYLTIVIQDDGKGLDQQAILAKAKQKGLINPKQELSAKEIFSLIFLPGFSTKTAVSEVSGRGVGMDVVQTNVNAMRGQISIDSQPGKGTTFTLTIPLAISLLDAMILKLGDEKLILPLHMVVQSFRFSACKISPLAGSGNVVTLRNENIPIIELANILQVRANRNASEKDSVVIVTKDKTTKLAVVVDQVLGIQTVVSKPLGAEMQAKPGISGCAILGDGKTSLILDIAELYHTLNRSRRAA